MAYMEAGANAQYNLNDLIMRASQASVDRFSEYFWKAC